MIVFAIIVGALIAFLGWYVKYTTENPPNRRKTKDVVIVFITVVLSIIGTIFLFVVHPIIGLLILIPVLIVSLVNKLFK